MKTRFRILTMTVCALFIGSIGVRADSAQAQVVNRRLLSTGNEHFMGAYIGIILLMGGLVALLVAWSFTLRHIVRSRTRDLREANRILQEQQEELTASNEEIEASLEQLVAIEQEITRQKIFYEALFLNTPDAIVQLDEHHNVMAVNQKFTELFGYSLEEIKGRNLDDFVARQDNVAEARHLTEVFLAGGEVNVESVRYGKGSVPIEVSIKGIPILYQSWSNGGYTIYSDIGQRKSQERELIYHSSHDDLTGLYNRRYFGEYILRLDREFEGPVSVIMADVNGLKMANDAWGSDAGDVLLKILADIFQEECGPDCMAARIGGDDFAAILPERSGAQTEEIVHSIKARCWEVRWGDIPLSVSFGWAEKKSATESLGETLKAAEMFMNRHKLSEASSARGETIQAIINTLHEKNPREEEHSQRVSILCQALGEALGVDERQLRELKTMGLLHDIGKIAVDETILNKTDRLTPEEFEQIRRHPEIGYRILSSVNDMAEMAEYVLAHHERWDGNGYPKGLRGMDIPYLSRIIGVVDAYDAMTRDRAYRKAMTEEAAIQELQENAGIQFDPEIVKVFLARPDVRFSDLAKVPEDIKAV